VHLGLLTASLLTLWSGLPLVHRVEEVATPYLSPLHLRVDQRPLGLVRFDVNDWPHRIEWRSADGGPWQTMSSIAPQDPRLSRLARAIAGAAAQEDTATASMLLVPWIQRWSRGMAAANGAQYELRVIALAPSGEAPPLVPEERLRVRIRSPHQPGATGWVLVTTEERRLTALPPAAVAPDNTSEALAEVAGEANLETSAGQAP